MARWPSAILAFFEDGVNDLWGDKGTLTAAELCMLLVSFEDDRFVKRLRKATPPQPLKTYKPKAILSREQFPCVVPSTALSLPPVSGLDTGHLVFLGAWTALT